MLKMTEICQVRDKPKLVQLFFPVLKKPFWLKTILRYFMLEWRSRKNFITSRLCSELIVISLHRACACSLQAYGPKSLSLQALKNTGVWTTLVFGLHVHLILVLQLANCSSLGGRIKSQIYAPNAHSYCFVPVNGISLIIKVIVR